MAGMDEKEVARFLSISRNTVHHHIKGIYEAFAVSSRGELLGTLLQIVADVFECPERSGQHKVSSKLDDKSIKGNGRPTPERAELQFVVRQKQPPSAAVDTHQSTAMR